MSLLSLATAYRCTRLTIPVLCNVRTAVSTLPHTVSSSPLPSSSTVQFRYYATGSHSDSRHWSMERYISVSLLTLVPAAAVFPGTAVVDYGLAVAIPLHGHWGLQQVITDYVHGATMNKICNALIYVVSMGTCLGLLYLNYHDVGVTKAVAKLWSL